MVEETRTLERALGNGHKKVEKNELEARIVQRRCVRYASDLAEGHLLSEEDLVSLRPAPLGSVSPFDLNKIVGQRIIKNVVEHETVAWEHF